MFFNLPFPKPNLLEANPPLFFKDTLPKNIKLFSSVIYRSELDIPPITLSFTMLQLSIPVFSTGLIISIL